MYCPVGSPAPVRCPAGLYTDYEGAESCTICPEGYYCVPEKIIAGRTLLRFIFACDYFWHYRLLCFEEIA